MGIQKDTILSAQKADKDLAAGVAPKTYGYRWRICGLLFFATTLNYLDRNVLSILAPGLQREFGWSEIDYGNIVIAFQAAYGLGVVMVGKLLDYKGVRVLYACAVFLWSVAGMAHALATSVMGFISARFALGLGEAANFPAALKTISAWFPATERALVAGIFNAGSNVGIIAAALLVPPLALHYGWQGAFVALGLLGFFWVALWLLMYREPEKHPKLSASELKLIQAGNQKEERTTIPWMSVLLKKETIIVCVVRFISDPTWWFLLFWLPKFLNTRHGIQLADLGLPMIMIYVVADIGSVAGGWLSSQMIKGNKTVNIARKRTMLICALCVVPVLFASRADNLYVAVALISLAAAGHTGWMANVYAMISDLFPRNVVGAATGLSTLSAVAGGMAYAATVSFILETTGSYALIFFISSFAYLLAWCILRWGIREIRLVSFQENQSNTL